MNILPTEYRFSAAIIPKVIGGRQRREDEKTQSAEPENFAPSGNNKPRDRLFAARKKLNRRETQK
jgi:hypothetical protein